MDGFHCECAERQITTEIEWIEISIIKARVYIINACVDICNKI